MQDRTKSLRDFSAIYYLCEYMAASCSGKPGRLLKQFRLFPASRAHDRYRLIIQLHCKQIIVSYTPFIGVMSPDSTTTLHKFVVYAPDRAEEGTFEKRLSVRAKHLENAGPLISAGIISTFDNLLPRYLDSVLTDNYGQRSLARCSLQSPSNTRRAPKK